MLADPDTVKFMFYVFKAVMWLVACLADGCDACKYTFSKELLATMPVRFLFCPSLIDLLCVNW